MTVRPKDSYNYRLFWRVSWREVAEALGYKTAHTAIRSKAIVALADTFGNTGFSDISSKATWNKLVTFNE